MVFRWRTFKFDQSGMKPGKVETLDIALMMLVVYYDKMPVIRWASQPISSTLYMRVKSFRKIMTTSS